MMVHKNKRSLWSITLPGYLDQRSKRFSKSHRRNAANQRLVWWNSYFCSNCFWRLGIGSNSWYLREAPSVASFLLRRLKQLLSASVANSRLLNMKLHFVIGESYLTLSEVSMKEQGQRRLQTRKQSRRPRLTPGWLHINCKRMSKIL